MNPQLCRLLAAWAVAGCTASEPAGNPGSAAAGATGTGGAGAAAAPPAQAGAPGASGTTGGSAASPSSRFAPVRVIRGAADQAQFWDLTVRGAELGAYDGKIASVRIGDPERPPERLGSGQARIEQASFELSFPQVWEAALYKSKRVFIDVDGNGRCDRVVDRVFSDARATDDFVLIVRETASDDVADFPLSSDPEVDCAALNAPWPEQ